VYSAKRWARLYYNVTLIECDSPEALDDLLAHTPLGQLVVQRVSDRAVIVDGQQKSLIARSLGRRGHSFRIVDLPPVRADDQSASNAQ
jgi:hypothetical protein